MGIGVVLLAIAAAQASPPIDSATHLVGIWNSDSSQAPMHQNDQRIAFTEDTVFWPTHSEPILGVSLQDNLIVVRTRNSASYTFEWIGLDSICLVTREQPGVQIIPQWIWDMRGREQIRPSTRDGLATVNCYRRQPAS